MIVEWENGASIRSLEKKYKACWISIRRALEHAGFKVRKNTAKRSIPCTDCSAPVAISPNGRFSSRCPKCFPAWKNRSRVEWERRRRYSIEPAEYNALLAQQGGLCAICGNGPTPRKGLSADHDHATGKVRSLLCGLCNMAIGGFREDITILQKAIKYLRLHKSESGKS